MITSEGVFECTRNCVGVQWRECGVTRYMHMYMYMPV